MDQSDGSALTNTAHYYTECSNKGLCDRATATCNCFAGYEGSACNRASCPNGCSGHGVCKTIRELAAADYDNTYELWDAEVVSREPECHSLQEASVETSNERLA